MRAIVLAAAAVSLIGLGCVEDEAPPAWPDEPEEALSDLSIHADRGGVIEARVGARDIVGPEVNVARYHEPEGGAMRGKAFGLPVNLAIDAGRVTGLVGGQPVDVTVTREGRALRVDGIVRGSPSSFRIDPLAAKGRLGSCSYELARDRDVYTGRRACGGGSAWVRLRVPDTLACWQDAERAAAFAVVLGG
jgi:hypothetical protein